MPYRLGAQKLDLRFCLRDLPPYIGQLWRRVASKPDRMAGEECLTVERQPLEMPSLRTQLLDLQYHLLGLDTQLRRSGFPSASTKARANRDP